MLVVVCIVSLVSCSVGGYLCWWLFVLVVVCIVSVISCSVGGYLCWWLCV